MLYENGVDKLLSLKNISELYRELNRNDPDFNGL